MSQRRLVAQRRISKPQVNERLMNVPNWHSLISTVVFRAVTVIAVVLHLRIASPEDCGCFGSTQDPPVGLRDQSPRHQKYSACLAVDRLASQPLRMPERRIHDFVQITSLLDDRRIVR